jgi:hypothetical protein
VSLLAVVAVPLAPFPVLAAISFVLFVAGMIYFRPKRRP